MTAWILSFGWNWLLVPVAIWFARRFWLATREPSLKYLDHSRIAISKPLALDESSVEWLERWATWLKYPSLRGRPNYPENPPSQPGDLTHPASLLQVMRRERMFPWRRLAETWLVEAKASTREVDGLVADKELHARFVGMIAVADARKRETEELAT